MYIFIFGANSKDSIKTSKVQQGMCYTTEWSSENTTQW